MIRKLVVVIFVFLLLVPAAGAADVNGVTLPDTVTVNGETLVLNGAGIREKKIIFFPLDVYVAGLYLKNKSSDAQAIIDADETMLLKLVIVSGLVNSKNFKKATLEGFEESTHGHTKPIQKDIDLFLQTLEKKIVKGDVFDLQYIKGKGVFVYKNGSTQPEQVMLGLTIKKALFGIWLGNRSEKNLQVLTKELLGK